MKLIPLTQGLFAKVSDHRFEYLNQWKWFAKRDHQTNNFYAFRQDNGRTVSMHRFIMNTPDDLLCDHKNRDTLDNQDENLRNCTKTQNRMNAGKNKNNKSGYKGVHFDKHRKKYRAFFKVGGKTVPIGSFDNVVDAAQAYDAAVSEAFGEFAYLNFPESVGEKEIATQ